MSYPTRDDIRKDKERNILRLKTRLGEKRETIVSLLNEIEELEAKLETAIVHYTKCWPDHPTPE